MIQLILGLADATLKVFVGYIVYLFAVWLQVPEWGMIIMICMAVMGTSIKYEVK